MAWMLIILVYMPSGAVLPAYKHVRNPAHCVTLAAEAVVAARGDGLKMRFACRRILYRGVR